MRRRRVLAANFRVAAGVSGSPEVTFGTCQPSLGPVVFAYMEPLTMRRRILVDPPKDPGSAVRARRLTSRILTNRSEHESFARMFESHGGNAVDLDYLCKAKVRGFFRGDELLGGYVLNARAPFRYSSWVRTEIRAQLHQRGYLVEATCAELTCMWMSKGLRKLERNRIYVQSVIDAFRSRKRFIFAGSCVDKIARIQKSSLPKTVYKGEATFAGTCEMYCATRYVMVANFAAAAIATYARDVARMIRSGLAPRHVRSTEQARARVS